MKILVVEPEKAPYEKDISSTLACMQELVGGDIEAVFPYDDPVAIICNEEGKLLGLPMNRQIHDDVIAGTFFICGISDGDFASLGPEMAGKYMAKFQRADEFQTVKGPVFDVVFHKMTIPPQPDTPEKQGTPRKKTRAEHTR